jgi:hypothetical protein
MSYRRDGQKTLHLRRPRQSSASRLDEAKARYEEWTEKLSEALTQGDARAEKHASGMLTQISLSIRAHEAGIQAERRNRQEATARRRESAEAR